ncbi:ATP-binding cassette domain-containing protein, partial [Streptomyces anulatus]|uniref:ATP-binding cassette domain-containing protein n=1 Tax=Streptomyces anulatus TaxID=1892 RepID=UPI0036681A10
MTLTLTDVTLTYPDGEGRLTALDRVSLDVPPGTLTAVVGPSGSGKSSLLAAAATLVTPDSGEVVVAGTPTAGLGGAGRAALRREHIGIVFQQPNLLPSLTAAEQLQVMRHLSGGSARSARRPARVLVGAGGRAAPRGGPPPPLPARRAPPPGTVDVVSAVPVGTLRLGAPSAEGPPAQGFRGGTPGGGGWGGAAPPPRPASRAKRWRGESAGAEKP